MRVGIDVGGTFTDLIAWQPGGTLHRLKVSTTPRAPEEGALAALRVFLESGVGAGDIDLVVHASTIATNALLGQVHLELPRVAFVTTAGFRDVLEIGRQNRSSVYDLGVERPAPLARREDRFAVRERRDADGSGSIAPDLDEVDAIASELARRGIRSVAIGFLHADIDDAHEVAVAERLAQRLPDVDISRSAELVREFREYERFSTAVVNAALMPVMRRYLDAFARGVRAAGVRAPLFVMRSDGGMAAIDAAARRPASLIESGPAGGVVAAAQLGRSMHLQRVLSFDMGGTTAKAGTILDGVPEIATEFEAAGATHSGRALRGSGYPVRFPFVDLAEVSAGGGTIAWLDRAGTLRVGPQSAGADPGPAAYGRGEHPTVTDANVVLGRLNPSALLGGAFPIDAARAATAVASVAAPFSGDAFAAAAGIVALVDFEMAKVLRIVSIERGHDPRDFTLVAFGGGGPLHACAVAREIGVRRVVIPPLPGLFSAYGLLTANVRVSASRSHVVPAEPREWPAIAALFDAMHAECEGALAEQNVPETDRTSVAELELRYVGQSFGLTVTSGAFEETLERFHILHERRYGYAVRDEAVEVVTLRVTGIGRIAGSSLAASEAAMSFASKTTEPTGTRSVWDGAAFTQTPVFERERLSGSARIEGPAVIAQYDATTYVGPGWLATIDANANLLIEDRVS